MADFSHRPGWSFAPDGASQPQPQPRTDRSLGPPRVERGGSRATPVAETEYRVWRALRDGLAGGEMIFSSCRVAGAAGRIDHIVVASSGVWVVDAKKRKRVSYRRTGQPFWRTGPTFRWTGQTFRRTGPTPAAVMRLFGGKHDITFELDRLSSCLDLVAQLVHDPTVPVRPAMAIFADQCSLMTGLRFRLGRPVLHEGVLICPPQILVEQIRQPGPLSLDQVVHVGHRLDEALPVR